MEIKSVFNATIYNSNIYQISEEIKKIFHKDLEKIIISNYNGVLTDEFINPKSGGAHFPKFIIWSNEKDPNKVYFCSNYQDGLSNLANIISKNLKCHTVSFMICNDKDIYPGYRYAVSNNGEKLRLLQLIKDGSKWDFFMKGKPLEYEDTTIYESRYYKNKLNNEIIINFLKHENININTFFEPIKNGILFERIMW